MHGSEAGCNVYQRRGKMGKRWRECQVEGIDRHAFEETNVYAEGVERFGSGAKNQWRQAGQVCYDAESRLYADSGDEWKTVDQDNREGDIHWQGGRIIYWLLSKWILLRIFWMSLSIALLF